MSLSWWRLEMPSPAELEESLIWKLNTLGIPRVAVRHRPEAPEQRLLLAWRKAADCRPDCCLLLSPQQILKWVAAAGRIGRCRSPAA